MDAAYWKERCAAAEAALAKARRGITMTAARRRVLAALGELHPGEWMDTREASELLATPDVDGVQELLRKLEAIGLVERTPGQRGVGGAPSRWRLGHLVVLAEAEPAT